MTTLRNYAKKEYIAAVTGVNVNSITDSIISQAESDIDLCLADFWQGSLSKKVKDTIQLTTGNYTYSTGSLISNSPLITSKPINYFVGQVVENVTTGICYPVVASNNALVLEAGVSALSGTILIYQYGKAPFLSHPMNELREAVAYQVAAILDNFESEERDDLESESIGTNYSYKRKEGGTSPLFSLARKARNILIYGGYTHQSYA